MFRFVTEVVKRRWDGLRRQVAIWVWDQSPNARYINHNDQDSDPHSERFHNEVVFVRWDAKLGDTIVLSWVWRALQKQRPDLKITVITAESFKDLFTDGYGIESVYVAAKRHGWGRLGEIAREIRHPKYVVHLSLKWRARDIRFVRELAPEHVVGLDDELKLVDVKLGAHTRGRHFSEKLVPWLEQLGVDTSDRSYWVARTPTARLAVDQWWPTGGRVVGFCPYGASRKKCLNDDWIKRIVTLCLDHACQVVMLVLPAQRTHIAHLIADHGWGTDVIVNPGDSTQYALFEQVARSDAVVSVDTAVVHLAVGFQKPLLSIYNSVGEEFDNWHPNHTNARVVRTVRDGDGTVNALDESELLSAIGCVITRHPPGNPI